MGSAGSTEIGCSAGSSAVGCSAVGRWRVWGMRLTNLTMTPRNRRDSAAVAGARGDLEVVWRGGGAGRGMVSPRMS